MRYEFEAIARPLCLQDGKATLNILYNEENQIEWIVQQKKAIKPTKCSPPKRYIFTLLGFLGMVVLYALRVNLSVAIVSMVKTKVTNSALPISTFSSTNESTANLKPPIEVNPLEGEFNWDEATQALVLGSFFWGYVVFQLPGGQMADRFGGKWLLFSSILITSLLTIISPIAARWHYTLFIGCRVLEGLFEGCAVPAMHSMIAKWFPANERSTAAGIIYSGMSIGTVVTLPIAALLCDSVLFNGWPSVFYAFGLAGIIWSILWALLVSETPVQHPTISQQELRMILSSQNSNGSKKKPAIPWKAILTSVPVWALTITHFGQHWGFYTLLTQMPRYFKELGFDLKSNGVYSALPYLSQAITTSSIGIICDRLYRTDRFTLPTLRKFFNSVAYAGSALCMFLITLSGRDRTWNILLLTLALGINGIGMAGFTVTHVDMSPNFAGTLMGLTNFIANFAGVLVPLMVGQIMTLVVGDETGPGAAESSLQAWHYVFYVSAAIFTLTGTIYVLFGSIKVQPWNDRPKDQISDVTK